jgi:hypothetical protein
MCHLTFTKARDMEVWTAILAALESGLAQLGDMLTHLPSGIILAGLALPILLAGISRRLTVILSILLLVTLTVIVFFKSDYSSLGIALASYVGSILVALIGLRSRLKTQAIETAIASMQAELNELRLAEDRRRMIEVRSTSLLPETPFVTESHTIQTGSSNPELKVPEPAGTPSKVAP